MRFHYRLNDGVVVDACRTTGWCYTCGAISPIEILPDSYYIGKILEMIPMGDNEQMEADTDSPHTVHQSIVSWLRRRKAFPRCLECGSEDNVVLRVCEGTRERRPILGFRHECGGELYLTTSDMRIAWAMDKAPHKYLDEEGWVLEEEQ